MRLAPVATFLVLLLAGCVQTPTDDAPASTSEPLTLEWGFTGCDFAVAFIPIDAARVAPYLPEGFRVLSFAEAGFPPDPRGSGNLGTELFVCESGQGLNGTVESMVYGSVFAQVQPPEELASEGTARYFVKWDVLVPDADRRELLVSRGVPAVEGSGTWTEFRMQGDQAVFDGALEMNGTTTFRGATLAPADEGLRNFRFTEFTATPGGLAMWNTTVVLQGGSAGAGTVRLAGLAAEIAGASEAQAVFLAARGDFTEGSIWLPPTA